MRLSLALSISERESNGEIDVFRHGSTADVKCVSRLVGWCVCVCVYDSIEGT